MDLWTIVTISISPFFTMTLFINNRCYKMHKEKTLTNEMHDRKNTVILKHQDTPHWVRDVQQVRANVWPDTSLPPLPLPGSGSGVKTPAPSVRVSSGPAWPSGPGAGASWRESSDTSIHERWDHAESSDKISTTLLQPTTRHQQD